MVEHIVHDVRDGSLDPAFIGELADAHAGAGALDDHVGARLVLLERLAGHERLAESAVARML